MEKIKNPFLGGSGYHCFGCSPDNEHGLRMQFFKDGDEVVCSWDPSQRFEGYTGVLHGGIQTTLMDELASWFVFVQVGTAGATSHLEVDFLSPVYTTKGPVSLRASFHGRDDNKVTVLVKLSDGAGKVCAEGRITYFTYPESLARRKLRYPGRESFVG